MAPLACEIETNFGCGRPPGLVLPPLKASITCCAAAINICASAGSFGATCARTMLWKASGIGRSQCIENPGSLAAIGGDNRWNRRAGIGNRRAIANLLIFESADVRPVAAHGIGDARIIQRADKANTALIRRRPAEILA